MADPVYVPINNKPILHNRLRKKYSRREVRYKNNKRDKYKVQ